MSPATDLHPAEPPPAITFEHVGLVVADLDRSIEFYKRLFGFSILRRSDVNAYLYLGSDLLELVQAVNPSARPVPTGQYPHRMNGPANLHLGFRVQDLDQSMADLMAGGAELISGPSQWNQFIHFALEEAGDDKLRRASRPHGTAWRIAVFRDPDGAMIELVER